MELTNVLGLPEAIVRAVSSFEDSYFKNRDKYRRSDISVTQLLEPPRKVELSRRHRQKITEDASERIYALLGQSIHSILEHAGRIDKHVMVEERIYTEVQGWTVSGQMDRALVIQNPDGYQIDDFKLCSVWEAVDPKPEKEQQLNLLAALLRRNGKTPVVRLRNILIFRDWSKARAGREPDYPQRQVSIVNQRVWAEAEAENHLEQRVTAHQIARSLTDDAQLPPCSPEERWEDPDAYAVMKGDNKKATKLLDSLAAAEAFIGTMVATDPKVKAKITLRPSEPKRCISYCPVNSVCSWYAAYQRRGADL